MIYEDLRIIMATLVGTDGIFHLVSSLETFMQYAPDWIIAQFFGTTGFGILFHRIIAIILIGSTIVFFTNKKVKDVYILFIAIPSLVLISSAIILRLVGLA